MVNSWASTEEFHSGCLVLHLLDYLRKAKVSLVVFAKDAEFHELCDSKSSVS